MTFIGGVSRRDSLGPPLKTISKKKSLVSFVQRIVQSFHKKTIYITPASISIRRSGLCYGTSENKQQNPVENFPLDQIKPAQEKLKSRRLSTLQSERTEHTDFEIEGEGRVLDKSTIEKMRRDVKFWSGSTKKKKTPECRLLLEQIDELKKLNRKDSVYDEAAKAAIKKLKSQIDMEIVSLKAEAVKQEKFLEIDRGKAKRVLVKATDLTHVIYVPVKGIFSFIFSKEKEMREELRQVQTIKANLRNALGEPKDGEEEMTIGPHLAIDMEELEGENKVQGKFTLRTERAAENRNLEREVSKNPPSLDTALDIAEQILDGLRDLHLAGYVHGDLKLENVLIFLDEKGRLVVKIADFGKSQVIGADEDLLYTGNDRYAPFEGRLSKRGEVFSAAVMLIRILEADLLRGKPSGMLIRPENEDAVQPRRQRKGIEKYLVLNKNTPQTELSKLRGRCRILFRSAKLWHKRAEPPDLTAASREMNLYIGALVTNLQEKHPDKDPKAIDELGELLKEMTDPVFSPEFSMNDALIQFKEIREKL